MQELHRCRWVNLTNPAYVRYHDLEWGRPHYDDTYLFELLLLESFQAGLSWECILNKREAFRRAFDGFDPQKIAAYDAEKCAALMQDSGGMGQLFRISLAFYRRQCPARRQRHSPRDLSPVRRRFRRPPRPRHEVRRLHHYLFLFAGRWHRERP